MNNTSNTTNPTFFKDVVSTEVESQFKQGSFLVVTLIYYGGVLADVKYRDEILDQQDHWHVVAIFKEFILMNNNIPAHRCAC
ncbi:hypothetical protein TNCV_4932931 [Trichonephila clavipes]|nr:hypothetical protein TNCV_4932931 [Trichonephila clavipes]